MKPEDIKPTLDFIHDQIITNIQQRDMLNDRERQQLYRNIEHTLDEYGANINEMLEADIADMYERELYKAMRASEQLGFEFRDNLNSMAHTDALNNIVIDTMLDMAAAIRTAKMTSISSIDSALESVNKDIAQGILLGSSRDKIVKRVAASFNDHGMKAFITVDGRALPLDFYSETITRTKISKARATAHAKHYDEVGNQHFTIHGAYDTCAECASYRDIIFTMTGEDSRFTYLDPAEALPFHPNCRCGIRPVVVDNIDADELEREAAKSRQFDPNTDQRTKEQRKAYEDDQRAKRKAREEMKQYHNMVAKLGDDAPKTLGAFRRMKRANSKNYRKLMAELRKPETP